MKGRWPAPRVDVRCDHCKKPLQRSAAVALNKRWYHPAPCFGRALTLNRSQLELAMRGPFK
jgi:hypothetical protein